MSLQPPRASTVRLAALLMMGLLVATAPSLANPLLDCAVLVHVQPFEPDFCSTSTISTCEQVMQHTAETGLLEFDLFVYTPGWGFDLPVSALSGACQWPPDWQYVGHEICHGGDGLIDVVGPGALLDLYWPECPRMSGEVFLAARFLLEVPNHGKFDFPVIGTQSNIAIECPPDEQILWVPLTCSAEAGVVCDYCQVPCDLTASCDPQPSPSVLELQCFPGETAGGQISGSIAGHDELYICDELFVETDTDWLSHDLWHQQWEGIFEIEVEADASGLGPGTYETWLRVIADCAGCTRVVLNVRDPQTIPDQDPDGAPQPAGDTSWGRLKQIYR